MPLWLVPRRCWLSEVSGEPYLMLPVSTGFLPSFPQCFSLGQNAAARSILSIINKSDLFIDSRSGLVFRQCRMLNWEEWTSVRRGAGGRRRMANLWEESPMRVSVLKTTVFGAAVAALAGFAAPASAADVGACLITKTDTNPFFVKMKEGATAKAKELGVNLKSLRRQDRRRQRKPGGGDRDLHCRRRQGHPDHRRPTPRASCRRSRRRATPASWSSRSTRRSSRPTPPTRPLRPTIFMAGETDRAVGRSDPRRQGQGRQDRLPRPCSVAADRRRAARPGLHDGLRHRREGPQQDRRRGRSAHRRPRRHQRQRRGRPQGHGEPAPEGPRHQCRPHDQRAGRSRRL